MANHSTAVWRAAHAGKDGPQERCIAHIGNGRTRCTSHASDTNAQAEIVRELEQPHSEDERIELLRRLHRASTCWRHTHLDEISVAYWQTEYYSLPEQDDQPPADPEPVSEDLGELPDAPPLIGQPTESTTFQNLTGGGAQTDEHHPAFSSIDHASCEEHYASLMKAHATWVEHSIIENKALLAQLQSSKQIGASLERKFTRALSQEEAALRNAQQKYEADSRAWTERIKALEHQVTSLTTSRNEATGSLRNEKESTRRLNLQLKSVKDENVRLGGRVKELAQGEQMALKSAHELSADCKAAVEEVLSLKRNYDSMSKENAKLTEELMTKRTKLDSPDQEAAGEQGTTSNSGKSDHTGNLARLLTL